MQMKDFARGCVPVVALALPLIAAAQSTTPSGSQGSLDEVVVTANKLNAAKVLDVPTSIQAISGGRSD